MASQIELQDDTGAVITNFDFGAIDGGDDLEIKFYVKNIGATSAESVRVYAQRLAQNDGLDLIMMALDNGGNPGSYVSNLATGLVFGTIAAGVSQAFWVKITVPTGTTPAGNPRLFHVAVEYTGT
jgi:hypothetical protein